MSEYQITYKRRNDEFGEWFYYFAWCYKFDDAIGLFRDNFSKDEWEIVSVSYSREMDDNRFIRAIREEEYVETYPQEV